VLMDVEMSDLDLGDLDLHGMEDAFQRHTLNSISTKKIQLLKEALHKSRDRDKLGIQNIQQKELKRAVKDIKKHGCKTDLQRINTLGTMIVESGQYA
jgi:hypothetical protein